MLPFSNAALSNADVSYSAVTDGFTFATTGTYLLVWNVLVDTVTSNVNIVLTLEYGGSVLARSGEDAVAASDETLVSGSAVVTVASGSTLFFRNRSGSGIRMATVTGASGYSFTASVSVVRLS